MSNQLAKGQFLFDVKNRKESQRFRHELNNKDLYITLHCTVALHRCPCHDHRQQLPCVYFCYCNFNLYTHFLVIFFIVTSLHLHS